MAYEKMMEFKVIYSDSTSTAITIIKSIETVTIDEAFELIAEQLKANDIVVKDLTINEFRLIKNPIDSLTINIQRVVWDF